MSRASEEEVAQLLRLCDFAMDHAQTSLVAFVDKRYVNAIKRDFDRIDEVRRQVAAMLDRLPPESPMTPEREAECAEIIARALRRFHSAPAPTPQENTQTGRER